MKSSKIKALNTGQHITKELSRYKFVCVLFFVIIMGLVVLCISNNFNRFVVVQYGKSQYTLYSHYGTPDFLVHMALKDAMVYLTYTPSSIGNMDTLFLTRINAKDYGATLGALKRRAKHVRMHAQSQYFIPNPPPYEVRGNTVTLKGVVHRTIGSKAVDDHKVTVHAGYSVIAGMPFIRSWKVSY